MSVYLTGSQSFELDIWEGGDSNGGLFPSFHTKLNGPKIPQKTLQDTAQKMHALAIERETSPVNVQQAICLFQTFREK